MKKITAFMFAATAFVLLFFVSSSCGQNGTEQVRVGVAVPLTGPLSSNGLQMRNGMELALGEINGSPLLGGKEIRFIVEDSEGTPDGAERAYTKLVERDGVVAVLGPFTSSATERIISVADENGVVAFSPTSAASGLSARSEFVFRASLTVGPLVQAGVALTKEHLRYSNVAVIVNEADSFSSSNHEKVKQELQKHGVRIVSEQTYSRQTGALPDLTSQLSEIMNAVPAPEALFISALAPGRRGIMIQARQLGINIPFLVTLSTQDDVREAADAAEGAITFTTWIADIDTSENRRFLKNFRAEYGEPDAFAALSYVSAYILAEAIAGASSADRGDVRDAMADIRADTLLGDFHFDPHGDAVYEPVVGIVENGKFRLFAEQLN